ncbi:hypothetical protein MMC26_001073 [Xylographa opegraphella]|nr:hypothetical protein [Xylographa opegraphella]
MNVTDDHYDAYDYQHYGHSGSRKFGSGSRNERLNYLLSRWEPCPSFQGGIHDDERNDWMGDFEAHADQSQIVRNNETMLPGTVYPGDYAIPCTPASLPVRGLRYRGLRDRGFPSLEDNYTSEYHHSWCTDLPVSENYASATLGPNLYDYSSSQFFQHLPNRAKVPDLTDYRDNNNPDIDLPESIYVSATDESPIDHGPLNFHATFPTPKATDSQHGDFFKQQWHVFSIIAASLRRQRCRIRHCLRILHRAKRALEIEKREFRNMQKYHLHDPEHSQSWYSLGEIIDANDSDDTWRPDTQYPWGPNGKRTEQPREEDLLHEASKSDNEPGVFPGSYYHRYSRHHYFGGRDGQTAMPRLTADVVSQAKNDLARYDSAWTSLSEHSQTITPRIPYPTVTMHFEPLLEPFPAYIRLPRQPAFHPPAHVRIQFHALQFYLYPLGLQASLTFDPPVQSFDDPEQVPDAILSVDEIESLGSNSLQGLKCRMISEIRKWHEDVLRNKGFGTLLDFGSNIKQDFEGRSVHSQYADDPEGLIGDVHDFEEKRTERDVVQGIWAAVQLLKDLVFAEMKRRNMK